MPDPDSYDDELVSANQNQRNWRGILIALLVIIIVLALIVTSVSSIHNPRLLQVLLTPPDEGPRVKGERIKLQDIVNGEYNPGKVNGDWVGPDEFLYENQWGEISLLNVANLSTKTLMSNTTFKALGPVKFSVSRDREYLLLAHNVQKLFRHSFLAQYSVFDIASSETFQLSPFPDDREWPWLLHAQFTPNSNSIVMVYKYDIYFRTSPKSPQSYRVTKTGVPGVIHNGVADWLYEEEVLGTSASVALSNDGHLMLYATFNDTLVSEQKFSWYGVTNSLGGENLYPEIRSIRYPKPGTTNPTVTLNIADLANPKNIRIRALTPPAVLANADRYFTSAAWISQTEVSVVWLNRPQNLSVVSLCKSPMWECQETHRVSGDNRGWVDEYSVPFFSANGSSYIAVSPLRDGGAGHFRHLVHIHISKKQILPLTHGRYEVTKIVYWDQVNNFIYYLGTPEYLPGQQHLYRVSSNPPKFGVPLRPPRCLTCPSLNRVGTTTKSPPRLVTSWEDDWEDEVITAAPPTSPPKRQKKKKKDYSPRGPLPCQYHTAHFSPPSATPFVQIDCLGPEIPTSAIYRIVHENREKPLQLILTIQNNTRLKEKVAKIAMPQIKSFPVMISGGYYAQVRLFLPPGLREDEITRYPMILHVYSAPGTQLVTEKWRIDWNTYLAGSKDYIVTQIDGRGSSGQGYQLLHEVYRRLGTVEVSDQLEVTEYLRDNLHFVDKRRVGVYGWSFGGFTATLALANSQSLFQCGISVSPVTNWKLYDSAYTERYMGLPNVTDNYKGYDEADLTKVADMLRDKHFMMVHGTADDNVHFQQSMILAKALAAKGALFKQQIYPDEGHNLSGVKRHLYRSMTLFFDDCFKKQIPIEMKSGLGNGGSSD